MRLRPVIAHRLADLADLAADCARRDVVVAVAEAQEAIRVASGADLADLAAADVVTPSMMDGRGDWAEWEAAGGPSALWNKAAIPRFEPCEVGVVVVFW